jgi:hypothetical protein
LSKSDLGPTDQEDAGKAAFAAQLLSSLDEVEGKDQAMGQPGKVVSNGLTCEFASAGKGQIEALIYGPGKTGEDSTLYVNAGPAGLSSFGFLDKGDHVEVRGQVLQPSPSGGLGGYVVAGTTPDPT